MDDFVRRTAKEFPHDVAGWARFLMANEDKTRRTLETRGWERATIERFVSECKARAATLADV